MLESAYSETTKSFPSVKESMDRSSERSTTPGSICPSSLRPTLSSQWCLRELAQIVANTSRSEGNKVILPIFFDVDPDDVKVKTPLYRDAILNLELEKKLITNQVDAWREALVEVDAIKGWEVKKYKGHGELINLVVEKVVEKLKTKHRLVTKHLVGIDDRVVAISKLLDVNSGAVRFIQIYGMGVLVKRLSPRSSSTNSLLFMESVVVSLKVFERSHQEMLT